MCVFSTVIKLQGMHVKVLLSPEEFVTYISLVVFLLHMNRFCVALEVIITCESSATHVTDMVGISCMCNNVPFKVPLCMEMFIALNAWILW